MSKVAILTDFLNHDPAYSLCGVVGNQVKMIKEHHKLKVFVREGFNQDHIHHYSGKSVMETSLGDEVVPLDPGEIAQNVVNVTDKSEDEITHLTDRLKLELEGFNVVLTHDVIYQANMWKYHVAIRRVAKAYPEIKWLHWVHSTSPWSVANQTKQFERELEGRMPNSKLVVMNAEEINRKAGTFGYEIDQVVLIPNPFDPSYYYTPEAREILDAANAWLAEIIGIYPVRLDRGKQVEIPIEIFGGLVDMGFDVRFIVVDFHSTGGDKAPYRVQLKELALHNKVPIYFTSDLGGDKPLYRVHHKTVMDLFDFADVFIHPSRSECDPLTLPEAMWSRNQLMLNFDLPMFRLYDEFALMGKFSSNIDALTGEAGSTDTNYSSRKGYMRERAACLAYMLENNKVLKGHRDVRLKRSLKAIWKNHLGPAIEGA